MFQLKFNPLMFLMALGSGGVSVALFTYLQYVLNTSKSSGLVNITNFDQSLWYINLIQGSMILFSVLHFVLMAFVSFSFVKFIISGEFKKLLENPLTNSPIMASVVSLTMSFNVIVAVVRYFVPGVYNNLESFMLPALIGISAVLVVGLTLEFYILKKAMVEKFDLSKMNFGWLLQGFAMVMIAVTASGIAALSENKEVGSYAGFVSILALTFGMFLLFLKVPSLFKVQLDNEGLPDRKFLPSTLIIVPITTLMSITIFRLSHLLNHLYDAKILELMGKIAILIGFAIETWFLLFGIYLLADYFKSHLHKEVHISQFGLICPFVAYPVLGAFVYKFFGQNELLKYVIIAFLIFSALLFIYIFARQMICMFKGKNTSCNCVDDLA